jgi:hypothetical protein
MRTPAWVGSLVLLLGLPAIAVLVADDGNRHIGRTEGKNAVRGQRSTSVLAPG